VARAKLADRSDEGRAIVRGDDLGTGAVPHVVPDRPSLGRDDREGSRSGFEEDRGQAVSWAGGHHDAVACLEERFFPFAGHPPFKGRIDLQSMREGTELVAFGAVAGDSDADRLRESRQCVKKVVEAFYRHQAP
jgi:hypothetical protein